LTRRRPIFAKRGIDQTIGYFDDNGAYDLSGNLRCRYSERTGNLTDLASGKIVGHVSLEGRFVGSHWLVDELFPMASEDLVPIASTSNRDVEVTKERSDSSDADIARALDMVRQTLGQR
jgi:hypothetical protein